MLKRKDKGILDQFLPAIVVIVLLAVLWTGSMISASNIDRSSDIHQVARTYLLRMEADGYLTEENRNLMISELEALDMENIDLTGTSFTDVGYGNQIRMVIREELGKLGIEAARIRAVDKGALDCTIRARIQTAVYRASGEPVDWEVLG